jgi:hypothetical protein
MSLVFNEAKQHIYVYYVYVLMCLGVCKNVFTYVSVHVYMYART